MANEDLLIPSFIPRTIDFPEDNVTYELLKPYTDLRSCHDTTPPEARIVLTCRRIGTDATISPEEFVMKIKVQEPGRTSAVRDQPPQEGPSDMTTAELEALRKFRDTQNANTPHLVTWRRGVQGADGPLPGGYLTYTVMTKVDGETLLDLDFWNRLSDSERKEVTEKFLLALREVYKLGMEPMDRALRNILWDQGKRKCSVIDFEQWRETNESLFKESAEPARWGLARSRQPKSWMDAWNMQYMHTDTNDNEVIRKWI